jgi:ArsR family transcriptional regulator, arsenate/arsenite/antimonite-responsive transcriptional repressor
MTDKALMKALKALAHPTRFRMVQEIAAAGELSCGELGERFPLSQPTVSHHLKLLTESGVLAMRREAQHGILSVDRRVLQELLGTLPTQLALGRAGAGRRSRRAAAPRRARPH